MKKCFFVLAVAIVGLLFSCKQSVSSDKIAPIAQDGGSSSGSETNGSSAAGTDGSSVPSSDDSSDTKSDGSTTDEAPSDSQVENGYFIFKILEDGTASVVGVSEEGKAQANLDIPSKITIQAASSSQRLASKNGANEVSVSSIGEGAFEGNVVLASIHIPSTVTIIGGNAFKGCEKLENVNIPDGVVQINAGTFEGCESLENISLGNVSNCDPSAFSNCSNLKGIVAMEEVAQVLSDFFDGADESEVQILRINASAYFRYTNYYQHVRIDGLTEQGKQLETIEIPYEIDGLPVTDMHFAILEGSHVKKLVIPSSFTTIPVYGCEWCDTLEEVYLPDSIRSIETYAFRGDTALRKVVMKEGVETIDTYAFLDCSSLREVELPYSVKNCLVYAFLGCPLESMIISDDTYFDAWGIDASKISYKPSKYVYDEAASGIVIKGINKDIFGSTKGEFVIPDNIKGRSVVEIADSADFSGCEFTSIVFPSGIRRIGANAFTGCANLSKVRLSASVEIADGAFSDNVEIVKLGGSSGKGSISSQGSIFSMHIDPHIVFIESISHDYLESFVERFLYGEAEDLLEIYIPYEVDGIPVYDVFIDHMIYLLNMEMDPILRHHDMFDHHDDAGAPDDAGSNQFCCIIYLPVDRNMENRNMIIKRVVERATETIAETGAPVMIYTYYCPELD